MSQVLDYSIINHKNKYKTLFDEAIDQRDILIENIEYKHSNECPKDCKYIKEDILLQLRVCEDQCKNNSRYKKLNKQHDV